MAVNYGSKRIVVGAHYGLRDWLASASPPPDGAVHVMLLVQVLFTRGPIGYDKWAGIFAAQWMKVLTFVVIVALLYHVWVGMRDIWMDYVKPVGAAPGRCKSSPSSGWSVAPAGPSRFSGDFEPRHDRLKSMTHSITKRKFDVVIVGAGGSGMRASLQLARAGLNVAVLSKVFPTRSHTVAAQGGIGASLGNMSEDNWHYHFYDTVKGSDWLGDQDAIEFMCREAPKVVYELEHFGMPFDRNPDGTIYQRPFGGHTANYGEKPVQRACAAADRTGHAMLHTLYQQNVKAKHQLLRRVDGAGPDPRRRRRRGRRHRAGNGNRRRAHPRSQDHAAGHRRRGPHLCGLDQRLHQHRRRPGHGGARRHPAAKTWSSGSSTRPAWPAPACC